MTGSLSGNCGGLPGSRSKVLLKNLVLSAYQIPLGIGSYVVAKKYSNNKSYCLLGGLKCMVPICNLMGGKEL